MVKEAPKILGMATVRDYQSNLLYKSTPQWLSNGTFSFAIKVPYKLNGGEYFVNMEPPSGMPSFKFDARFYRNATRKIRIFDTEQPQLFVTVDYDKTSYVPGDELTAKMKVKRPDNQPLLTGSSIAIKYQLVGKDATVLLEGTKIGDKGELTFKMKVPSEGVKDSFTFSLVVFEGYAT